MTWCAGARARARVRAHPAAPRRLAWRVVIALTRARAARLNPQAAMDGASAAQLRAQDLVPAATFPVPDCDAERSSFPDNFLRLVHPPPSVAVHPRSGMTYTRRVFGVYQDRMSCTWSHHASRTATSSPSAVPLLGAVSHGDGDWGPAGL